MVIISWQKTLLIISSIFVQGKNLAFNNAAGRAYHGSIVYNMYQGQFSFESTDFAGGRITGNYAVQYHITDHLGNVRTVLNNSMTILEQNDYYPFGQRHPNPAMKTTTNRYRYNSKEQLTEVETIDYGARQYSTELCHWLQVDPLAEKYKSLSSYNFCANNPLKFVDVDGRKIVDPNGNEITYKDGQWSKNATTDVRRIGESMMATPKGTDMFSKMLNAPFPITLIINSGNGEGMGSNGGNVNGTTTSISNGHCIESATIIIYEGAALSTINKVNKKAEYVSKGKSSLPRDEEARELVKSAPLTLSEQIANVAAHEAEHATNKAANVYFEPNKSKREFIANQTQIEVIKQTRVYRWNKIQAIPAKIVTH